MADRWGKVEIVTDFIFLGSRITADGDCSHEIKRCLLLGRKGMTNLDSMLKSRDQFSEKGPYSQSYGFSSSHIWMWELDHKECWALQLSICGVRKDSWKSPLDRKAIKAVHPKGNQSWIFIGRTDAEAETLLLWPPDAKSWLIWNDPDVGKDRRREENRTTEDEMVWMASLTQWTWIWANSGRWWRTGKPEVLQSMGSQRVWHKLGTEQQQQLCGWT